MPYKVVPRQLGTGEGGSRTPQLQELMDAIADDLKAVYDEAVRDTDTKRSLGQFRIVAAVLLCVFIAGNSVLLTGLDESMFAAAKDYKERLEDVGTRQRSSLAESIETNEDEHKADVTMSRTDVNIDMERYDEDGIAEENGSFSYLVFNGIYVPLAASILFFVRRGQK